MSAILRITRSIVAFGDSSPTSNPRLRFVDWSRDLSDIQGHNPRTESHSLQPGEEKTVFDGSRTLTLDGVAGPTGFSVSLVAGTTDHYRFAWTNGNNPGFRTSRTLDVNGATVSVTLTPNNTAVMAISGGKTFAGVEAGDTLWLPSTQDNITSPFSVLNRGLWSVAARSATQLALVRLDDFQATEETVTLTSNDQLQAFSSTGVQAGDKLEISGGFAPSTQKSFQITSVTPRYLEVFSAGLVPSESGIFPGATNFAVYSASKSYVYVEADQECVVRVNGDTGNTNRVSPWAAGDPARVGTYERTGPTRTLKVLNKSSVPMNITVISVE